MHLWLQQALVIAIQDRLFLLLQFAWNHEAISIWIFGVHPWIDIWIFEASFGGAFLNVLILEGCLVLLFALRRRRGFTKSLNRDSDISWALREVFAHHRVTVTQEVCVGYLSLAVLVIKHALRKGDWLRLGRGIIIKITTWALDVAITLDDLWIHQEFFKLKLSLSLAHCKFSVVSIDRFYLARGRKGILSAVHGKLLSDFWILANLARSAFVWGAPCLPRSSLLLHLICWNTSNIAGVRDSS